VLTSPHRHNTAIIYLNYFQAPAQLQTFPYLVVRSYGGAAATSTAIRQTVERGGREFVARLRTVTEQRNIALAQERLLAALSTAYGALGLTLAAVGLYGLFSFLVAERRREIGVRIAMGAARRQVVGLFVREAAILVCFGLLIGLPAAFAATRAAAALLQGGDAGMSLLTASVLLVGVALAAVSIPARRAASLDPMVALRQE
jgi:ABC-type antimicrobial peptide transport system permease subunit